MPVFDYVCDKCQHVREKIYLKSESPLEQFPCKCGGKYKKQIGATATHFKGSFPGNDIKRKLS